MDNESGPEKGPEKPGSTPYVELTPQQMRETKQKIWRGLLEKRRALIQETERQLAELDAQLGKVAEIPEEGESEKE